MEDIAMNKREFIEEVFELAFGCSAFHRDFEYEEVLEKLREFSDTALKWENSHLNRLR